MHTVQSRSHIYLVLAAVLGLMAALTALPAKAAEAPPPADTAYFADGGSAKCMTCHRTAHVTDILKTHHAVTGDNRTPFAQRGCESCHGPSGEHVAGFSHGKFVEPAVVFDGPHASPVAQRNAVCLTCHQNANRINWQGSPHEKNDVACATCHSVHEAKDPVLGRLTQAGKCFACHKQQRAESFLYSHHPIREGKVICSDCHNPHGSAGPHQVKEFTVNETCYNCHADKRGPMLFEHQPVREDCMNCHTPHGSTEARLMKERQNFMCSSCHSSVGSNNSGGAFGGGHALRGNLLGAATFNSSLGNNRGCLNCHSQVHGSNSPNGAYFFR